jgi:translation initiation factor 2B subunit (eIF-2B alpha/beta/delta family)
MAPLTNLFGFLITDSENLTKKEVSSNLKYFNEIWTDLNQKIEENFTKYLLNLTNSRNRVKIMLISYSSTINRVLENLKSENIKLYVLESRPLFEGRRSAKRLSKKFKTYLIADMAFGYFIDSIDLVLVGIDSILKDGTLINKIGTYPLSVVSRENDVEVYAIGSSLKYNLKSHFNLDVLIEEKDKDEILDSDIKNVEVQNFYFDKTPPQYISGIISDLGVLSVNKFLEAIKGKLNFKWFSQILKIDNDNFKKQLK